MIKAVEVCPLAVHVTRCEADVVLVYHRFHVRNVNYIQVFPKNIACHSNGYFFAQYSFEPIVHKLNVVLQPEVWSLTSECIAIPIERKP